VHVSVNGIRLFFDVEGESQIAKALPAHLVQFERFANCGHAVVPDAPERAMARLREFILRR
jgi:hypothetical protein